MSTMDDVTMVEPYAFSLIDSSNLYLIISETVGIVNEVRAKSRWYASYVICDAIA